MIVFISFAYTTGPEWAYMGLPRHLLLAFPVFLGAGSVFAPGKRRELAAFACMLGMLFLMSTFALEGWVP